MVRVPSYALVSTIFKRDALIFRFQNEPKVRFSYRIYGTVHTANIYLLAGLHCTV